MDWSGAHKNMVCRPDSGLISLLCHTEHLRTACFDLTDVAHGFIKSRSQQARAATKVPGSIREIVPCLSSPAAYASEWI